MSIEVTVGGIASTSTFAVEPTEFSVRTAWLVAASLITAPARTIADPTVTPLVSSLPLTTV